MFIAVSNQARMEDRMSSSATTNQSTENPPVWKWASGQNAEELAEFPSMTVSNK